MYPIKNLRRRSGRSALTIMGISLAIALTVVMFSLSSGIRGSVDSLIQESGVDLFVGSKGSDLILGGMDIQKGRDVANELSKNNSDIRAAYPLLMESLYASPEPYITNETTRIFANGLIPKLGFNSDFKFASLLEGKNLGDFYDGEDPFYANGSYADGFSSQNFTHMIVINDFLASFLNVSVNDTIYLSKNVTMSEGTFFNVTGIIKSGALIFSQGKMSASMHLSELQYITGKWQAFVVEGSHYIYPDPVDQILIDIPPSANAEEIKNWIEENYELSATTQEELIRDIGGFIDIYEGYAEMITIVTVIIALLFTSTVMMIAIKERTGEIGVLRAIGFSKRTIAELIIAESIVICAIGFIIGFGLGYAGSLLLNQFLLDLAKDVPEGFHFTIVTPLTVLQTGGFAVLVGLISSLFPAYYASTISIAKTIRSG